MYAKFQKELAFLEKFAFEAMMSNTILTRKRLIQTVLDKTQCSLEDNPCIFTIGILNSFDQGYTGTQNELDKDHYFVHRSFQEFFATRHIVNALKSTSSQQVIDSIKKHKYNDRFAFVLSFAPDLTGFRGQATTINLF